MLSAPNAGPARDLLRATLETRTAGTNTRVIVQHRVTTNGQHLIRTTRVYETLPVSVQEWREQERSHDPVALARRKGRQLRDALAAGPAVGSVQLHGAGAR
jgi:hypothetical protein